MWTFKQEKNMQPCLIIIIRPTSLVLWPPMRSSSGHPDLLKGSKETCGCIRADWDSVNVELLYRFEHHTLFHWRWLGSIPVEKLIFQFSVDTSLSLLANISLTEIIKFCLLRSRDCSHSHAKADSTWSKFRSLRNRSVAAVFGQLSGLSYLKEHGQYN